MHFPRFLPMSLLLAASLCLAIFAPLPAYAVDQDAPAEASITGYVAMEFVPGSGWGAFGGFDIDGEVPVSLFGKEPIVRAGAKATVGMRTEGSEPGPDDVGDVTRWRSVELSLRLTRVLGKSRSDGVEVTTSAYGRLGGEFSIDPDATLEPEIAKKAFGGIRVQTHRIKDVDGAEKRTETSDTFLGVGINEECYPSVPQVLPDGSTPKTLQAEVETKLPIYRKGDLGAYFIASVSMSFPRREGYRDVATVGLGAGWK